MGQQAQAPPQTQETQAPLSFEEWGHHKTLSPTMHKRAVLELLQRLAVKEGKQDMPADIMDLMDKGDVVLLDENNQRVNVAKVICTWND